MLSSQLMRQVNSQSMPNDGFESWSLIEPFESASRGVGSTSVSVKNDIHIAVFEIELVIDTFSNPQLQTINTLPEFQNLIKLSI